MADVKFRGVWDGSEVVQGFEEVKDSQTAASRTVQNESKKQKKAIKEVGDEAKKVKPPQVADQKATNLFRQQKKELQSLRSEAIRVQQAFEAGEASAQDLSNAIAAAARKQADLADLQDAIKSLDPDTKATAFTNLASTGVQAGQAIGGAFALAGFEGENYQKLLVRLQSVEQIGQGIRAIGQLPDEWNKAKFALSSYVSTIEAKAIAQNADFKVTDKANLAQRGLSAALSLSSAGYAGIAIAIGVAVGLIANYISSVIAAGKAEEIRNRAVDGTIIKNKVLRDSYNDLVLTTKQLAIELKVARGELTPLQGALQKIDAEKAQKLQLAQQDYNAAIAESGTLLDKVATATTNFFTGSTLESASAAEAQKKFAEDTGAAQIEATKQSIEEIEKARQAEAIAAKDLQIEGMKTQKAILEAAGKDTVEIQRQIIIAEAALQIERVGNVKDAANQIAIIEEQRAQQLLALDAQAEAERVRIAKEAAEKRKRIAEDLFKTLQALNQQIFAQGEDKNLSPEQAAKAELEKNIAAIQALKTQALKNGRNLNSRQRAELEASLENLVSVSYRQYYEKLAQLRAKEAAKEAANFQASFAERLKRLDASQQIELNDIELWNKQSGESEEEFQRRKERTKLQIQLEFAKKRLEILIAQGAAENQVEISNLQVLIKQLQAQIDAAGTDSEEFGRRFLKKLLGVDDEGLDAIIGEFTENFLPALQSMYGQQIQQQEEALAKKKELNDAEIAENDRKLAELQRQLDLELQANAQGLTSNVAGVRDAIEQERQARAQNLEDQKRIAAEQEKLARRKAFVESGQQLSSITLAVANIIKGWSEIPLIGSILGIAAAGLMLASFVGLKAKAAGATRAPGFATGTKKAPPGFKWVGEEGPELINDRGGYAILSNPDSEKLMQQYNIPFRKKHDDIENALSVIRSRRDSMKIVPFQETGEQKKAVKYLKNLSDMEERKGKRSVSYTRSDGANVVVSGASTTVTKKING